MTRERLYEIIEKKKPLYGSEIYELKELVDEYPYFQQIIFLYLRSIYHLNDDLYQKELKRLSTFINDRKALFYFVFEEEYKEFFVKTGKKEIAEDQTAALIDAFFSSHDDKDKITDKFEYEQELAATAGAADYFSSLGRKPVAQQKEPEELVEEPNNNAEEETPATTRLHSLIDAFINKSNTTGVKIDINKSELQDSVNETVEDNSEKLELDSDVFFTETLAKIYIKQGKYEKAVEIIKHLSLNFPEKNIYFADQLSFLEKLIINSKSKE